MACIEFIKSRISNGDGEIDAMLFWLKVLHQRAIDEEKRTDRMELILCRKLLTLKRITEAGITLVLKIKKNGHTIKCLSTSLKNLQDAIRIFAIRRNLTALLPEPVYVKGRIIPALEKRLGRLLRSSRLKMESARMRREKNVKGRVDFDRLVKVARGEVSVKKPSPMERANYTHRDMKARFECRHGSRIKVKALVWRSTIDTFPESDLLEEEPTTVEQVSEPSIKQESAVVQLQPTNACPTEEKPTAELKASTPSIKQEPTAVALQPTDECLTEEEPTAVEEVSGPSINQESAVVVLQPTNERLTEEELKAEEEDTFISTYINQTIHQASINYARESKSIKDLAETSMEHQVTAARLTLEPLPQTQLPKSPRKPKKKKKSGKVSPLTLAPLSPRGLGSSVLPPICPSPGSSPLSSPRSTSAEVNKSDGASSDTKSITSKNETKTDAILPKPSGGSTSVMDIFGENDLGKEGNSSGSASSFSPSIVKEKKQNAISRTWKRFRALFRRKNKVAPQ